MSFLSIDDVHFDENLILSKNQLCTFSLFINFANNI